MGGKRKCPIAAAHKQTNACQVLSTHTSTQVRSVLGEATSAGDEAGIFQKDGTCSNELTGVVDCCIKPKDQNLARGHISEIKHMPNRTAETICPNGLTSVQVF